METRGKHEFRTNERGIRRSATGFIARQLAFLLTLSCLPLDAQSADHRTSQIPFDRAAVFAEVCDLVSKHFYKKDFDDKEWARHCQSLQESCLAAKTHDEFASGINRLLEKLDASHTRYYSKRDPRRYQLVGIFNPLFQNREEDFFQYDGIGISTINRDNQHIITAAFDGLPASEAGLRYGDVLLEVDAQTYHPILSFAGKNRCRIKFRRGGDERQLDVPVEKLDGRNLFEHAMKASVSVRKQRGKTIGYIHVWSYAGSKFQEILREEILWGELSQCDALILDLRDGWGGADINYLNLFRKPIAQITSSSRTTEPRNFTGVWNKPVVLLTNERSTSGKELLAYGFKKLKLGKVIGEKTAGAVVAGRCFLLSNDDVLYLAVMDVHVDGKRLEHVGVQPDIQVDRSFDSTSINDPQIQAALEWLSK